MTAKFLIFLIASYILEWVCRGWQPRNVGRRQIKAPGKVCLLQPRTGEGITSCDRLLLNSNHSTPAKYTEENHPDQHKSSGALDFILRRYSKGTPPPKVSVEEAWGEEPRTPPSKGVVVRILNSDLHQVPRKSPFFSPPNLWSAETQ